MLTLDGPFWLSNRCYLGLYWKPDSRHQLIVYQCVMFLVYRPAFMLLRQ